MSAMKPGLPKLPTAPTAAPVQTPAPAAPAPAPAPGPLMGGMPGPAPAPAPPVDPMFDQTREFDDIPRLRTEIEDSVLKAFQTLPARKLGKYSLAIRDPQWTGPSEFTPQEHKDAILTGQSLGRKIRGTWSLTDTETGQEVASRKTLLATLPWLTPLGTMAFRGNDYTVGNQLRLLPGVYNRRKKNGEIESHVNVMPGNGLSHRYFLDPESNEFNIRIRQAKTPMMPLLRALEVPDEEIRKVWGDEIFQANQKLDTPQNLKTLYQRLVRRPDPNAGPALQRAQIKEEVERMRLNPEVSKATLGEAFENLNGRAVLAATRRVLGINRGTEKTDDRDHPAFQRIMGPEDLFSERVTNDYGRVQNAILRRAALTKNLDFIPAGALSRQLEAVLLSSGLAQCFDPETKVLTRRGWVPWPEVRSDDEFACLIDGQVEYHRPTRLINEPYTGEMIRIRTKTFSALVTPNHRLWCRVGDNKDNQKNRRHSTLDFELAESAYGRQRTFRTTFGTLRHAAAPSDYGLERVREDRHGNWLPEVRVPMDAWLDFLGWWLAEGWAGRVSDSAEFRVTISQCWKSHPEECRRIEEVLSKLPFRFRYSKGGREFVIRSKTLCCTLLQFGTKENKRIPRFVFDLPEDKLQRLFDAYYAGDGGRTEPTKRKSETVSPGLAEDLVELSGRLGLTGRVSIHRLTHRKATWRDGHVITYSKRAESVVNSSATCRRRGIPETWSRVDYQGRIYCAEVPGHLLYVMRDGKPHWSGNSGEEINPTELLDSLSRVSRMGEGGLPSVDSIPDEARHVNSAQLGILDPVRTPESLKAGVDLYAARGARKGRDGKMYFSIKDLKGQTSSLKTPGDLMEATIAFPGELKRLKQLSPEDQKSAWVRGIQGGQVDYVPAREVTHEFENFENAFSHLGNLVPFKSASKPQRMSMAARMSVTADTEILVYRPDGRHFRGPIAEYRHQPGDLSLSVDKATHQLVWRPVRAVIRHRCTLPLHRVQLASGRRVDATQDHSFVTLGPDGNLTKVHTQDLAPGLPIPRAGVLPVDQLAGQKTSWSVPAGNKHNAFPPCEWQLDGELGWIHGLYLAEGNVTNRAVVWANVEPAIQNRVVEFFQRCNVPAAVRSGRPDGKNDRTVVNWKQLGLQLVEDFGTGAYEKRVPGWVFFAPRAYRAGLLSGYLAGDGIESVRHERKIGASAGGGSRSRDLAWGISQIASTLGIDSTLVESEVDSNEADRRLRGKDLPVRLATQYRFNIRREHISRLPPTSHPGKDATWASDRVWSGKRSADWMPMFETLKRNILESSKRGSQARESIYRNRHTRSTLTALFGEHASEATAGWSTSGVWWDHVVSVEALPEQKFVYDLDMSDNVFACNAGVFVHNTTQALPLKDPESPLVQGTSRDIGGKSYENLYGRHAGSFRAPQDGVVVGVEPGQYMTVKYADGSTGRHPLYENFPYNRKSGYTNTALAGPGQQFKAGQTLVRSNFTNQDGDLALGLNLRTAFMPLKGYNYEDAIVVSRSAAQKLSSEHMYQHRHDTDPQFETGRRRFLGLFPKEFDRRQMGQMDDDGAVRIGTEVQPGDPLILAAQKMIDPSGRLHKRASATWKPAPTKWDHHHPGIVTDVVKDKKGISVVVKSHNELQVGDKLSGRYGDKGVVAAVVDDERMPKDKQGRPVEVALNELGVISRANASQVAEAILGKIAADRNGGKPYVVEDFEDIEDVADWARQQAEAAGVDVEEDLEDPETGTTIPNILMGNRFLMKLHHTSECYDDQTEVLTDRGWLPWAQVRPDDLLATVEDNQMIFEKPLELIRRPFDGELSCFAGRYVDYAVTPNHRMWAKRYFKEEFEFAPAYSLHGARFTVRQFGFQPVERPSPETVTIGDVTIAWEDYCELVGWLVAEGYIKATPSRYCVLLYQSESANPVYFQQIEELLRRLPFRWHYYQVKGERFGFGISSRALAEHINQHGTHSHNRRLPREILTGSLAGCRRVYSAMMRGDGSFTETPTGSAHRYTTTSKGLADDFQELCLRIGLGCVVRACKPRKETHYLPAWHCGVSLNRTDAQVDGDRNKSGFSSRRYVGDVFCATMRTGLLYVRRNGKPMLCGNSKGAARGLGSYTQDESPAKGGHEGGGSKRISLLNVNALLSHGACFMGSVNVETDQGPVEISRIVRHRMPAQVRCADPITGKVEYRPVIDWLCRCVPPEEILLIETTAGGGLVRRRATHRAIRCTRGHEFYTPDRGKVQAAHLRVGDRLLTPGTKVENWQHQLMLGSMMGDAYVARRTNSAGGFAVCHGSEQWNYLNWKFELLKNLGAGKPKRQKLAKGGFAKKPTGRFTLRQHAATSGFREKFYPGGVKVPPVGIVAEMGWFGLGVWFGDDGSCLYDSKRRVITGFRIHTCAFTIADTTRLAKELSEFTGLSWQVLLQNGKYPILHLPKGGRSGDQIEQFRSLIRPYLPPMLGYKIRMDRCGEAWNGLSAPEGLWLEECVVKATGPYRLAKHEGCLVYNITVAEHHNYVVHGVLVGNTAVLRDAAQVRGQKNPSYWLDWMSGRTPAEPDVPFVWKKFVADLQAGGVNVVPDGPQLHMMAMLDQDIDQLAGEREITNRESGRLVDQEFVPSPGGLFDPKLTGAEGERWAKITFPEPIPNPVMEEPIRRMLGLTAKGLEAVIRGDQKLPTGDTGPEGIQRALAQINVPKELALTRLQLKNARGSRREELSRKLSYLKAAQRLDIHPKDWMLSKAPVLPARFRPISVMEQSGLPLVSDPNWLYRELIEARDNLKTMKEQSADIGDERLALYQSMRAVVGLGDPLHPKLREKGISGVLKRVFGTSPKTGSVQQKLIGSTVDLVGRGVVVPNPDLDMDSIGIPESKAWDIYRVHIIRRLKGRGMPLGRAIEETEKRTDAARDMMLKEMEERPIMMDRAPVLHRFGEMAFWPRLTKDESVHVSPLVIQGFGMDFDGDAVQYHVPGTDDAARELAERLLPSRNLLSPADFKRPMHVPIREYALGLFLGSRKPEKGKDGKEPRSEFFENEEAAIRAFRRGEISHDTVVEVPD